MNKLDLIKYSIEYIENRIKLLDNKANILIAIEIGLLGILGFTGDKLLGGIRVKP